MRFLQTFFLLCFIACSGEPSVSNKAEAVADYKELEKVNEIEISTPVGKFKVWTKRMGDSPNKRVLLLHGGPGGTHEFFLNFKDYFPGEGIEYILYDQLGSYYSDQPSDTLLWTNERFVDEVEQVRKALKLDSTNFYLMGQSWGGILAMEYALKYQEHLKGLIITNMVSSIPQYTKYAHEVLGPAMPEGVFQRIMEIESQQDFENPEYMELLMKHHYLEHIYRKPLNEWSTDVKKAFDHLNPEVYVYMQGHSEFGITEGATLTGWDVSNELSSIVVPTLCVGATHDSMDPVHMEWMSTQFPRGRFHLCSGGSHLCQYDDPGNFFPGVIDFIHDVHEGKF